MLRFALAALFAAASALPVLAQGRDTLPKDAPSAPEVRPQPRGFAPDVETVRGLLGKKFKDPEVQAFLRSFPDKAEVSDFSDSHYHSSKEGGISVLFKKPSDELTTVFLYAEGADGFKQYRGTLPNKLTFRMTRGDVEKLLGVSLTFGGDGVIPYWVDYEKLGIGIGYADKSTTDLKNRIHHLYMTRFRSKD